MFFCAKQIAIVLTLGHVRTDLDSARPIKELCEFTPARIANFYFNKVNRHFHIRPSISFAATLVTHNYFNKGLNEIRGNRAIIEPTQCPEDCHDYNLCALHQ